MTSRTPGSALIKFVRDWILLAPLPIWGLYAASLLFGLALFDEDLKKGSLLVYGLCCFVAHFDELGLSGWQPTTIATKIVSVIARLVQVVVVGLSLLAFGGAIMGAIIAKIVEEKAGRDDPTVAEAIMQGLAPMGETVASVGVVIAVVGVVVGIIATIRAESLRVPA